MLTGFRGDLGGLLGTDESGGKMTRWHHGWQIGFDRVNWSREEQGEMELPARGLIPEFLFRICIGFLGVPEL